MIVSAKTKGMWFVKYQNKIVHVFYNFAKAQAFNQKLMAKIEAAIFAEMDKKDEK